MGANQERPVTGCSFSISSSYEIVMSCSDFYESFFDNAVLYVECQLAGALLRSAPADTMCQTADVLNLFCLNPLAFFWNGGRTMVGTFGHATHVLYFV